jgi:hypothetical protein
MNIHIQLSKKILDDQWYLPMQERVETTQSTFLGLSFHVARLWDMSLAKVKNDNAHGLKQSAISSFSLQPASRQLIALR